MNAQPPKRRHFLILRYIQYLERHDVYHFSLLVSTFPTMTPDQVQNQVQIFQRAVEGNGYTALKYRA